MSKKGFTLIELLAVIVILAIIALIAVPVVLNIIDNSKISAKERSIDLYGKSIELAAARKSLTEEVPSGIYKANGNTLTLKDKDFSFEVEYDKETENLLLDLIQVLDENNIPCMYDKVGKKLYYNKGTGEFKYE